MKIVHHHFDIISSTNDWAKQNLETFEKKALTLVTADSQTQGRGQFGRKWISPALVNLYASFCFFVSPNIQDLFSVTHVLAISVVKMLEQMGIDSQIKWPNDVLVEGKKIAGILCETIPFSDDVGVVLGIGLNVNMDHTSLEEVNQKATSLFLETKENHSVEDVLTILKTLFSHNLEVYKKEGFYPFSSTFRLKILNHPNWAPQ